MIAAIQRCSVKKVFLEISRNSQENARARVSFFNKVAGLRTATLLEKRLWQRCFPVNFAKFLGTPSFTEHLWWLLLSQCNDGTNERYHLLIHHKELEQLKNIWVRKAAAIKLTTKFKKQYQILRSLRKKSNKSDIYKECFQIELTILPIIKKTTL